MWYILLLAVASGFGAISGKLADTVISVALLAAFAAVAVYFRTMDSEASDRRVITFWLSVIVGSVIAAIWAGYGIRVFLTAAVAGH